MDFKRFTTKRFIFSMIGFITSTVLCWYGKINGEMWVYAMAIVIAGHHMEDLIKAWRGTKDIQ